MKKILNILLLLLVKITFAQTITESQALNIIGKQCMLSQRMAKNKVFLNDEENSSKMHRELSSSMIQFEQNTNILSNLNYMFELQNKVKTIELLWVGYKQNLLSTTPSSYPKTLDYSDIILNACKDVQVLLLVYNQSNKKYPYNIDNDDFVEAYATTNDIKYLSQKLSFVYTLYYNKYDQYNKEIFNRVINEIDDNIERALTMKGMSLQLKEKTDNLEYDWKSVKTILTEVIKEEFISKHNSPKPVEIIKICDKFLKDADLLIREYKSTVDINS